MKRKLIGKLKVITVLLTIPILMFLGSYIQTNTLLNNFDTLTVEQMNELTERQLLVCAENLDTSDSGAMRVEQTGNIYTLTFNSDNKAQRMYDKYKDSDDVVFVEFNGTLETDSVEKTDLSTVDALPNETSEEYKKRLKDIVRSESQVRPTIDYDVSVDSNNELSSLLSDVKINEDVNCLRIAVIDSGANGNYIGYNAVNGSEDITDTVGHGTLMCQYIEELLNSRDSTILTPIKIANNNGIATVDALIKALEYVSSNEFNLINISMSTADNRFDELLESYINLLYENNIYCVVSAGNYSTDADYYSPAKFDNCFTIGSCDEIGNLNNFSNHGNNIDFLVVSGSTSEAAAKFTGILANYLNGENTLSDCLTNSKIVFENVNENTDTYTPINNADNLLHYQARCGCGSSSIKTVTSSNASYGGSTHITDIDIQRNTFNFTFYHVIRNVPKVHNQMVNNGKSGGYVSIVHEYKQYKKSDNVPYTTIGSSFITSCQQEESSASGTASFDLIHSYTKDHPDPEISFFDNPNYLWVGWRCDPGTNYLERPDYPGYYKEWTGRIFAMLTMYTHCVYYPGRMFEDFFNLQGGTPSPEYYYSNFWSYTNINNQGWVLNDPEWGATELYYSDDWASGTVIKYKTYCPLFKDYSSEATLVIPYWPLNLDCTGGSAATTKYQMGHWLKDNQTVNKATKPGGKFKGWYTATSGGTQIYDANGKYTKDGTYFGSDDTWQPYYETTLYAQWEDYKYNIAYDGNGSTSGSMTGHTGVSYSSEVTLKTNKFVKDGYHFIGWALNPTGAVVHADKAKVKSLTDVNGATVTLYAVWEPNKMIFQYKWTDGEVGSPYTANTDNYIYYNNSKDIHSTQYINDDSTAQLKSANDLKLSRKGYTFLSWRHNSKDWLPATDYKLTEFSSSIYSLHPCSVDFFPTWERNKYTLKYDSNAPTQGDTSGEVEDQTDLKYDVEYKYKPYGFESTYYYQTGWNCLDTSVKAGDKFKNLTDVPNGVVTAYAEWTVKPYKVVYHKGSDNAVGDDRTTNCTCDTGFNLDDGTTFSRRGYELVGWSETEGLSPYDGVPYYSLGEWREAFTGALSTTKDDIVDLYCVWKPLLYTVVYETDVGEGEPVEEVWQMTFEHDLYNNYVEKHFTNTGYYIDYWVVQPGDDNNPGETGKHLNAGAIYDNTSTVVETNQKYGDICTPTSDTSRVVLKAHWAPIKFKLQYNNDSAKNLIATESNKRGYQVSTLTYTTNFLDYGVEYDLLNRPFTRRNKYGKSLFLGFGTEDEDKSLTPKWALTNKSPKYISDATPTVIKGADLDGQTTVEGTAWVDYFGTLNAGTAQTFNIYVVWDDCPGIEPVDIYWSMGDGLTSGTKYQANKPNANVKSGYQIEYDLLYYADNVNSRWDREGNAGDFASTNSKNNYYISYLDKYRDSLVNQQYVTTYEVKYTIEDDNGNKYTTSRKLYSGFLIDIMIKP